MPDFARLDRTDDDRTLGWVDFRTKANRFLEKTEENAMQGINPGGYYYAIWCRDASYILRDWFLSGHIHESLRHIYLIWSHQIEATNINNINASSGKQNTLKEKIVYGRGSPEEQFHTSTLPDDQREAFSGALPTTIYQAGYSEIYGKNPDIDSTALMVSTTSWILSHVLDEYHKNSQKNNNLHTTNVLSKPSMKVTSHRKSLVNLQDLDILQDPLVLANHLSRRMISAVQYLSTRDIDGDGILEQGPNEDWMDTALRVGKIVYSQAAWILALNNLTTMLSKIQLLSSMYGYNDDDDDDDDDDHSHGVTAESIARLADHAIDSAEKVMWSDQEGCYIDIHDGGYRIGKEYRTLTQDVSLYLVAITENTYNDSLRVPHTDDKEAKNRPNQKMVNISNNKLYERSLSTLEAIKRRVWKEKWPLDTEALLDVTGPWVLKPFQYHNHTFWPWTTGIEMLARSRFGMVEDCNTLLSTLASDGHPHVHAFYEWINPLNDKGDGAYPFRTGIAQVRIALTDILANVTETVESQESRR
jgi:hypothetical protein